MRANHSVVRTALIVAAIVAGVSVADAQVSTGGVRGTVKDASGAVLVGVTVEASSPARIGGAAVDVSNSQGLYRFDNLPVGEYTITFTLQGFSSLKHEGVRVEVARTVELDVSLAVGAMEQSVTVTGEAPVVDAVHASFTSNFNQQMLDNVPSQRTSWFDVVTAAPAVRSTTSSNSASFELYGSSTGQNSYQNDGVEVAAPSGGTVWSFPNPDSIEEVQVVGIGASAEYSGFQGGVVNIVTKSGSNAVKGSSSFFYTGNQLVGNNSPASQTFPYYIDYQRDFTFSLGGPVRKDRLWVIGIGELTARRAAEVGTDSQFAPKEHNYKPFAKVNARLSDSDQLEFQFSDEYFRLPEATDQLTPVNTVHDEHGRNPIYVGRWARTMGPRTLLEVRGGGIYIRDHFDPHTGDFTTPGHTDNGTGASSVNATTATRQNQNQTTLSGTVTHHADDFLNGSHDFKFGVQYSNGSNLQNSARIGGISYTDYFGLPYRATVSDVTATTGRVRSTGAFVQDNWTVNSRLTLNLGVRFDHSIGDVPETDKLDPSFTQVLGTYAGVADVVKFDNTSPRLGASYKLDSAGKTVAKVSYGRYYARMNTNLFQQISPGGTVSTTYNYNPATAKYDIVFSSSNPKLNQTIDPHLTDEWDDQFFVGIERELLPDLGINASFVQKKEKNFVRAQDVRSVFAPRAITDTFNGVSQTITVYNRTTPSSQVLVQPTNRPDDFRQDYKSFLLQAYKRFSRRWQLQGSYQWQRNLGYTNDGPSTTLGQTPNDVINAYGRLATDSTHAFRVSATSDLPWGVQVGVHSLYESGRPIGRTITVRGLSQGTLTLLAQPRGTYQLPSRNDLALRIGKAINGPNRQQLRLSLDIQNLFNDDTPLSVNTNSSQPTYGQTLTIFVPRRAMVGARYSF
jgi:outer membrane receptor protein involved in Fe transport